MQSMQSQQVASTLTTLLQKSNVIKSTPPVYETFFNTTFLDDMMRFYNKQTRDEVKDMRLVIGHCPQYYSPFLLNKTYSTKTYSTNNTTVELTKPTITSRRIITNENDDFDDVVFGISMECEDEEGTPKLYRVDVGSSRAFDDASLEYRKYTKDEHHLLKHHFLSRVPQVLEIIGKNTKIIRSTVKNMLLHQERNRLSNKEEIKYGGNKSIYYNKYMKYKQKYLNLKSKK